MMGGSGSHRVFFLSARMRAAFWLVLAGGCSDESLSPLSRPTASVPPEVGTGGAPPTGSVVRQVMMRNPFGSPADNLLADGDFELSIVPQRVSGQYGWIAFSMNGSPRSINSETGGLCRSGLRCGKLPANSVVLGRGTAAPNLGMQRASIWLKPLGSVSSEKICPKLGNMLVVSCDSFDIKKTLVAHDTRDDLGFCEYAADIPGQELSLCIYAEIGDVDVLADNATLLPQGDESHTAPSPLPHPSDVSSETKARLAMFRDILRRRMPLGSTPPVDEPARPD